MSGGPPKRRSARQPAGPTEPGVPVEPAVSDSGEPSLLYTVEEAAQLLRVRPSWLQKKAAARAVPCTFLGKHLRFSRADLDAVIAAGAQPSPPATASAGVRAASRRPSERSSRRSR